MKKAAGGEAFHAAPPAALRGWSKSDWRREGEAPAEPRIPGKLIRQPARREPRPPFRNSFSVVLTNLQREASRIVPLVAGGDDMNHAVRIGAELDACLQIAAV